MRKRLLAVVLIAAFQAGDLAAQTLLRPGGPLRIVLLVDSSLAVSSMINPFRAALRGFLEELPGSPEIAFVTTGGTLRIRVEPTTDRQQLEAAAESFAADGGGNVFLSSLLEADSRLLKVAPERRSVFVILGTDINPVVERARVSQYNEFLKDFLGRGGRAHAVIIRSADQSGITSEVAENLTGNTGGFYEAVLSATAVPQLMKTVAAYVAADQ